MSADKELQLVIVEFYKAKRTTIETSSFSAWSFTYTYIVVGLILVDVDITHGSGIPEYNTILDYGLHVPVCLALNFNEPRAMAHV